MDRAVVPVNDSGFTTAAIMVVKIIRLGSRLTKDDLHKLMAQIGHR